MTSGKWGTATGTALEECWQDQKAQEVWDGRKAIFCENWTDYNPRGPTDTPFSKTIKTVLLRGTQIFEKLWFTVLWKSVLETGESAIEVDSHKIRVTKRILEWQMAVLNCQRRGENSYLPLSKTWNGNHDAMNTSVCSNHSIARRDNRWRAEQVLLNF